VVTFGIAQVGLALLLRQPLARLMRRPAAWAAVALANLSAMTLFLWHQSAFLAVTAAGLLIGRLPGLHTAPAGAIWVAERVGWLPVFAAALAILLLVFRRAERAPRRPHPGGRRPGAGIIAFRLSRRHPVSSGQDGRLAASRRARGQAADSSAPAVRASTSIRRAVAGGSGGSP
jgi:hypothetical protein